MRIIQDDIVTFENVGLRYGSQQEILKDVNLTINSSDFLFLVGESGSGKSSLLKLIYGSLKPSRGYLNILGQDSSAISHYELSIIRRNIGVIFQDFQLINHLTIYDNIALPLRIINSSESIIKEKTMEMLKWINLIEYKDYTPLMLSGGQQQQIAIARSVINNPSIILADEPTGSVDPKTALKIFKMFEELNQNGVAVVFATHNLDLVERTSYSSLLIEKNRIHIIEK